MIKNVFFFCFCFVVFVTTSPLVSSVFAHEEDKTTTYLFLKKDPHANTLKPNKMYLTLFLSWSQIGLIVEKEGIPPSFQNLEEYMTYLLSKQGTYSKYLQERMQIKNNNKKCIVSFLPPKDESLEELINSQTVSLEGTVTCPDNLNHVSIHSDMLLEACELQDNGFLVVRENSLMLEKHLNAKTKDMSFDVGESKKAISQPAEVKAATSKAFSWKEKLTQLFCIIPFVCKR